jgi:pyrimidine/purine-5'-nucleotide nucleosidase
MDKVRKSVATPKSALLTLTPSEVNALCVPQSSQVYELFKKCALAVLTSGLQSDDPDFLSEHYADFDVRFERSDRGIALHLTNAPAEAYVDGELVAGLQEHLFAVLRDIIYVQNELQWPRSDDAFDSADATESVFKILRHANAVKRGRQHGLVVCWGGHSISREEYDYSKELGYELGLRGLDICTGCGIGAMKGPMKGATIAHSKQRIPNGRYIGLTEPGIIAAEAPNAIVNELIIMPDIEKRLEAFVRLAHAIIIFPGGAGTAEEILYLLSVLSAPQNQQQKLPVILTGPASGKAYFETIISFIANSLGEEYAERVEVRIDDAAHVAADIKKGVEAVFAYRDAVDDAQYFNWSMSIDTDLQQPFEATHEKMAALQLSGDLPAHVLARNLRSAFSGIVSGNVKKDGIERIRQHGPFQIHADAEIGRQLDELLAGFVADQRMRLPGTVYKPCYEIIRPRN